MISQILYSLGIYFYGLGIRIGAIFNTKARRWVKGRKRIFERIQLSIENAQKEKGDLKMAWFHCASLGEFEQGRPVIEAFKKQHSDYFIFLTFFSPSGYEVRNAYTGADFVYYLPLDTPHRSARFISVVKPDVAFFVKYEFWFNYLEVLQKQQIPVFLISSNFRTSQHFFKWYGNWPRKLLSGFSTIFVQNENSKELLEFLNIKNVIVSGDTRFDRVATIAEDAQDFPMIRNFASGQKVIIAGSTWPSDESILLQYVAENREAKIIMAPHQTDEAHITSILTKSKGTAVRLSAANPSSVTMFNILVIDSVGILPHLYQYGTVAYVGGGFGVGIHNILEAATFGLPVFFGPNYHKFNEASDLVILHGAFPIENFQKFNEKATLLLTHPAQLKAASAVCRKYVEDKRGATAIVLDNIRHFVS
jgi:3-deoxy-D-manno-octulosonic-acid transferase